MFADSFFENGQAIHGCGWAVTSGPYDRLIPSFFRPVKSREMFPEIGSIKPAGGPGASCPASLPAVESPGGDTWPDICRLVVS